MRNIDKGLLEDTLFIVPLLTFSRLALMASNLNVLPPYRYEKPIILRFIRELFFRYKLPYRQCWFHPINKNYKYFIIYDGVSPEYVEWLHMKYPNSTVIMCYMNKCNKRTAPNMFQFNYLHLWSADLGDCKKYKLNFISNYGAYSRGWIVTKETPQYDIFFVGKDKGMKRLPQLLSLKKQFEEIGLKTYFHIVAEHRYDRYRNTNYKSFMPYEECLQYLGKTKAILYLGYGSQEAVTIRVQESLIHKIKLITDCTWIKNFDFYNKDNIFIIDEDNLQDLPNFLNSPYREINAAIMDHIYIENLATEIITRSLNNDTRTHN